MMSLKEEPQVSGSAKTFAAICPVPTIVPAVCRPSGQCGYVPISPAISAQSSLPLLVNSGNSAVLQQLISEPLIQKSGQPTLTVFQVPAVSNMAASSAGAATMTTPGIIYALSQCPPFIGISSSPSASTTVNVASSLCSSDVLEIRQIGEVAPGVPSPQGGNVCNEPGRCQSGGELRLNKLCGALPESSLADGFCLVGAKSPLVIGMTLVVAVDRRYLPSEGSSVAMLGFSGNCVGCGASGFRYFTELSTHINLKLATQPKKQKHLKYYIVKDRDGKWVKGATIPWRGSETRKRSVPDCNLPAFGKLSEIVTVTKAEGSGDCPEGALALVCSSKKPRLESGPLLPTNSANSPLFAALKTESATASRSSGSPLADTAEAFLAFKLPVSVVCGVRPVLLLCQNNTFKLPNSVSDLIISDMLVGCFNYPDTLGFASVGSSTEIGSSSTLVHNGYVTATVSSQTLRVEGGHVSLTANGSEAISAELSNMEQTAADTLINLAISCPSQVPPPSATSSGCVQAATRIDRSTKVCTPVQKEQAPGAAMSLSAAVVLLTQYLCSAADGKEVSRDDISLMLNRSALDLMASENSALVSMAQSTTTAACHLSAVVNLLASSSRGAVKVISSSYSFQNGVYKALRWLHDTFHALSLSRAKPLIPTFVIILSTPSQGPLEFGVLVTGKTHAKLIADTLDVDPVVRTPLSDALVELRKQFCQTDIALSKLESRFQKFKNAQAYVPFSGYPGVTMLESQAVDMCPQLAPLSKVPSNTRGIFANQAAMAQQLLTQLTTVSEHTEILDLSVFVRVEILILVPPVVTLYHQTVKRLCESGLLNDLGLEMKDTTEPKNAHIADKYVIAYSDWEDSLDSWNCFVSKVSRMSSTLFILIFDQAQVYSLPQGIPAVLPNLKQVFESLNVIPLFVTSVPYMFQSVQSFIDPDNEVYWTDARTTPAAANLLDEACVSVSDRDMLYFGIREYCDSTRWNQQFPLVRHEDAFDIIVGKANRLNDVSYSRVQAFVLLRLYRAAIMVAAGICAAEPYTLLSYIQMVRDIIETPLRSRDGSGSMLMVRVPDQELAKFFHDVLLTTRDNVGFKYRFEVLYDDGEHSLELNDYYLNRMRLWKAKQGFVAESAERWQPRCLEELLDLPCILILAGKDRTGETFPRSLKYVDFHLLDGTGGLDRSSIEVEIGSVSCYMSTAVGSNSDMASKPVVMNNARSFLDTTYLEESVKASYPAMYQRIDGCEACMLSNHEHVDNPSHFSSRYPLPIILVSRSLWMLLHSDHGGVPGLMHLNPDPNTCWVSSHRPLLSTTNLALQSRHYRRWTIARSAKQQVTTLAASSPLSSTGTLYMSDQAGATDSDGEGCDREQYHPRCLLLSGPPQVGKTGAYLHFAYLVHRMLIRLKRVEVQVNRVAYTVTLPSVVLGGSCEFASPDMAQLRATKFVTQCLDTEFLEFSPVVSPAEDGGLDPVADVTCLGGRAVEQVVLAPVAAHDTLHHCDTCKLYREGMSGPAPLELNYALHNYDVESRTIYLQFIIPPMQAQHVVMDDESKNLRSMRLAMVARDALEDDVKAAVPQASFKTPVLMSSSEGYEEGLLNLYHVVEGAEHVHITFIQRNEASKYRKHWPNHIFALLPDELNSCSSGSIMQIMKLFATQNYKTECERQGESYTEGSIWPFFLFMADNITMWQRAGNISPPRAEADDDGDLKPTALCPPRDTTSLRETLFAIESMPGLLAVGLVGLRPWSVHSQCDEPTPVQGFIQTFLHSFVLVNVVRTSGVGFNAGLFIGENIDMQWHAVCTGVPIVRVEQFSFMSKATSRGLWRMHKRLFPWEQRCEDASVGGRLSLMVTVPDGEDGAAIDAPADLVLQKYLRVSSAVMFPAAYRCPGRPVLLFGGYVDLGRGTSVFVVRPNGKVDSQDSLNACARRTYGGLLIYGSGSQWIDKHVLAQFRFAQGARLCFVARDRYRMREEVTRLDLEERWRFRLKDEYQTATASSDRTNVRYFLTGSYCGDD